MQRECPEIHRGVAPVIGMSIIEDPEDTHIHRGGIQRAKQRIVSKETQSTSPFRRSPTAAIHTHRSRSPRPVPNRERGCLTGIVDIPRTPRARPRSRRLRRGWSAPRRGLDLKGVSNDSRNWASSKLTDPCTVFLPRARTSTPISTRRPLIPGWRRRTHLRRVWLRVEQRSTASRPL